MRGFPGGTSRQLPAGSWQLAAVDGGGHIIGTDINLAVPPLFARGPGIFGVVSGVWIYYVLKSP